MTLERAAELVKDMRQINRDGAIDLFCFFVDSLGIEDTQFFAELCEYPIATNVRPIDD